MRDGCKNCKYELQDEHLEPCLHCEGTSQGDKYTAMTNADRIRNMSDEELAEILMDVSMGMLFDRKIMNVKNWLQSEVEDN